MNANIPNPNACGAEVYDALCEQLDVHEDDNARVKTRHPWKAALTVWVMDDPRRSRNAREVHVCTTDISQSGFGFVCEHYIQPGATLRTRLDVLPNAPILDGIVVYCRSVGESLYRVGVQFVNAS